MEPVKQEGFLKAVTGLLKLIVFANLYITLCSFVMSLYTYNFFSIPVNRYLLLFIVFGTLCSYSFHWALPSTHTELSPREKWSRKNRMVLVIFFVIGLSGAIYSFIFLKLYASVIIPLLILTFLYSSGKLPWGPFRYFRKYFIGKTIYLALMWTLITVYLPLVVSGTAWNERFTFFILNRFFFLFAICILFDLRDKEADSAQGIKSLITLLDSKKIKLLFIISLFVSFLSAMPLVSAQTGIIEISILLVPLLLTFVSYRFSLVTRSELWYYFYLDGLMMLPGVLYIIISL